MYFRQFLNDRLGCCSYLIASRVTSEAVVVDPGVDVAAYERVLEDRALRLRYVIDTHVHADHISGARQLAATHGADLCLHESARVAYPTRKLRDGLELALGDLRLRVLHTPGHRPELISLLLVDPALGPDPLLVLTGDSLLVGDVGRPDFSGGDPFAQYDSVRRLLDLPEWTALFPGHFEGPCAAAMRGAPSSTIGGERRFNPLAKLDRNRFVATLASETPPRPLNITAIEATNRGHADMAWAMLTESVSVAELTVDECDVARLDAVLVDVREPVEHRAAHIPGVINIPQGDLASRLDEIPRHTRVICVCQAGRRSLRAAQFLAQVGYKDVANLRGGTTAWIESGQQTISPQLAGSTSHAAD